MAQKQAGTQKTCSRGHVFYKSSACPVCPACWPGYYKKKSAQSDLPKLSAPATRALWGKKITSLTKLATYTEEQILALHGMGPSSLPALRRALKAKKLRFKK